MNNLELLEAIELYGSDLNNWPEALRSLILSDPLLLKDFQWMSAEEAVFEQLLSSRSFEPHSNSLAQRIIAESSVDEMNVGSAELVSIIQHPFIRPLLGMAATLVLGLAIGYGLPLTQDNTIDDDFEDYTALFYVEGELL